MIGRRDILRRLAGAVATLALSGRKATAQGRAVSWEFRTVSCEEARDALARISDSREWLCVDLTECSGSSPQRVARRRKESIKLCEASTELRVVAFRNRKPMIYIGGHESVVSGRRTMVTVDCHLTPDLAPADLSLAFRKASLCSLREAIARGFTHHSYQHPGSDAPKLAFESWSFSDWDGISCEPLRGDQGIYAWVVFGPISAFLKAYGYDDPDSRSPA